MNLNTKTLTVYVGKNKIKLTERNYLAEGGEGRIYKDGDTIYKIYIDPLKVIPVSKIKELQELKHDNIITPIDLVFDQTQSLIGFTMKSVDGFELCRLFNTIYLDDNNITDKQLETLVENKIKTIEFIHQHDCLIVDGNEMNYLFSKKDVTKPYFIDVNAYATKSFKADAYTPLCTEPNITKFDRLSDWYSFAILACKIFVGMHPFKGFHQGYTKKDTLKRMIDKISIFNKDTKLPKSARDFSHIPSEYFKWFVDIFENGKRIAPPKVGGLFNVSVVKQQLTQIMGNFILERIKKTQMNIRRVFCYNNELEVIYKEDDYNIVLFGNITNKAYYFTGNNGYLLAKNPDEIAVPNLKYEYYFVKDNKLYIINNGMIVPMKLIEIGNKASMSPESVWNIPKLSSRVFDGVVSAVLFGCNYLYIPIERGGTGLVIIKHIKEFDGHKVVYARCEKNVCIVITFKDSKYNRSIIKFDKIFEQYSIRTEDDIAYPYINFTVLDNGVCIMMTENAEIEIFHSSFTMNDVKRIVSGELNNKMILFNNGTQVMFYQKNEIFKISVKK